MLVPSNEDLMKQKDCDGGSVVFKIVASDKVPHIFGRLMEGFKNKICKLFHILQFFV